MTPKRAKPFAELLREVVEVDGGFIPEAAWIPLHKLIPFPAVGVLIVRTSSKEFLLTYRKDTHWDGWHIPGGYVRRNETIMDACNRIARDEAGIEGVTGIQPIAISKWKSHPYGSPLSLVFVCHPIGEIKETDTRRFFREIPKDVIKEHVTFLGAYLNFVENRRGGITLL